MMEQEQKKKKMYENKSKKHSKAWKCNAQQIPPGITDILVLVVTANKKILVEKKKSVHVTIQWYFISHGGYMNRRGDKYQVCWEMYHKVPEYYPR